MQTNIQKYQSVADYTASLFERKPYKSWISKQFVLASEDERESKAEWAGTKNLDEAVNLLKNGWYEGAAKIKTQGKILSKKGGKGFPVLESAVVGCIPNVPNYLMGLPKQMLKVNRKHVEKPVINIYVNVTMSWDIDEDKIALAAAKIAGVVAATEKAGVRVNLYANSLWYTYRHSETNVYGAVVKIKDSRAPLNLLNIAFPLTHRAMTRRISFRWEETHVTRYVSGYGYPCTEWVMEETHLFDNGVTFTMQDIARNNSDWTVERMSKKINEFVNKTTNNK